MGRRGLPSSLSLWEVFVFTPTGYMPLDRDKTMHDGGVGGSLRACLNGVM